VASALLAPVFQLFAKRPRPGASHLGARLDRAVGLWVAAHVGATVDWAVFVFLLTRRAPGLAGPGLGSFSPFVGVLLPAAQLHRKKKGGRKEGGGRKREEKGGRKRGQS
jgi:hypothetical protein